LKEQLMLLCPRDCAARLGLSVSRVRQLDREGLLPAFRDSGNRRLWDEDVVELFRIERDSQRAEVNERQRDALTEAHA
jgi:DNA-binding transcriptional MerR regulator